MLLLPYLDRQDLFDAYRFDEPWNSPNNASLADKIGDIFCEVYKRELNKFKFREDLSDHDADKEENFYVLRKTNCPALMVENLFFDNRAEAEFLLSEAGRLKIAETLFKSIQATEKQKPI